ncbi:MAG TPA: hypothetical protein VLD65_10985 [Anaerolineales bacterium]|nr:hypothetical protein [Anaerolineales bacterium]
MDDYDYSEVKEPRRKRPAGLAWNILTILVLIFTLLIAIAFILIYINPSSSFNPFPPSVINSIFATPMATETPRIKWTPSWTPTIEVVPPTNTPETTYAPLATDTQVATASNTPISVLAVAIDYAFVVREGSPAAIDGSQFHPDVGCKWLGVAGQATSLNGEAVKGLFVHLGGSLPGIEEVGNLSMTGMAPQYGQGGFEITISDQLIASSGALWIQLLDQDNLPLSDRVYFDTDNDCLKNLVIIYFDQVH